MVDEALHEATLTRTDGVVMQRVVGERVVTPRASRTSSASCRSSPAPTREPPGEQRERLPLVDELVREVSKIPSCRT